MDLVSMPPKGAFMLSNGPAKPYPSGSFLVVPSRLMLKAITRIRQHGACPSPDFQEIATLTISLVHSEL